MPYLNTIPVQSQVVMLNRLDTGKDPQDILRPALSMLSGEMALVSSFGADSVVLLHMVAQIAPDTPVLFIDTQMLFRATLGYQKQVAVVLGLTDVRRILPDPGEIFLGDTEGLLHQADTDSCCALRKVAPLQRALEPFDAWITGRKQHQSATRADMATWEDDGAGRLKLNPLANWSKNDLAAYFERHDLPRHPLSENGSRSIGCAPCTFKVNPGMDDRAGRWVGGQRKTECGIHFLSTAHKQSGTP
jgi:phosphoadenosine phosphosulfate reductase